MSTVNEIIFVMKRLIIGGYSHRVHHVRHRRTGRQAARFPRRRR